MAARNPSAPGLFRRLLQRIGNPLEWSDADKCVFAALTSLPFMGGGWFIVDYYLGHTAFAAYFNVPVIARVRTVLMWVIAGWMVLLALALWFRKRAPESPLLVHVTIQFWNICMALAVYAYGTLTTPFWMALIVAGLVGFILFDPAAELLGIGVALLILVGTGFAEQAGLIPYGPALTSSPFREGHLSTWWFVTFGSLMLGGSVISLLFFAYVISRWRAREEQLREAHILLQAQKDQLVQTESLAAVGSLVTGAAHELRNPLSSSSALLQSLREDLSAATDIPAATRADALETLEKVLEGQRRATDVVDRLYSLSDDLAAKGSSGRLGGLLEFIGRNYEGARVSSTGVSLTTPLPAGALETVLSNLLDNAVAAGDPSPVVRISLVASEQGLPPMMEITVADQGAGIPEAMKGNLFRPFASGQKAGKGHGVGLGLYIVHEIVTRMGGSVGVASEGGKGTKATLRIPLEGKS